MFKDKKIVIIGSIAYLLCLYLTFILYAPKITVNSIKQSLQDKNAKALEYYIDFSSVQNSVIDQLKSELILKASMHKSQSNEADSISMAKVSYAIKMVEDFVGLFLSTNGFSRLFSMADNNLLNESAVSARKYVSRLQSSSFIYKDDFDFKSLNSIEIRGNDGNGKEHRFIFTFRFTRWVLTDILVDLSDFDSEKTIDFIKSFESV